MKTLFLAQGYNLIGFISFWVFNFTWDTIYQGVLTHFNHPVPVLTFTNFMLITIAELNMIKGTKTEKGKIPRP